MSDVDWQAETLRLRSERDAALREQESAAFRAECFATQRDQAEGERDAALGALQRIATQKPYGDDLPFHDGYAFEGKTPFEWARSVAREALRAVRETPQP